MLGETAKCRLTMEASSCWVLGKRRRVAASAVIEHEVSSRGYVPLFVDGTAIEVDGELFEGAARGYDGEVQYGLHGVFGRVMGQRPAASGRSRRGPRLARTTRSGHSLGDPGRQPLAELVHRHRGKQGQENAFKGPLIEMDLHHPPCRRFHANQAFYACGQIAQLRLRAVQYELLPAAARRHGLRPLIRYLMRTVARLVSTGRRWRLDFAKSNFRLDWLLHAARQLE